MGRVIPAKIVLTAAGSGACSWASAGAAERNGAKAAKKRIVPPGVMCNYNT